MSTQLNEASVCYIGYIENNPVCFFAVLHFPHAQVKNFKKGHRLVVLPDYQGLGIGHKFSSMIADMYLARGFRFIITSSTKALFFQRKRDSRWIITRKGRVTDGTDKAILSGKKNNTSRNKLTYSYEYIGA